ncbi:MAG: ABC transporter ATP-binding protein [Hyphomicrobiales bacterium]
MISIDSIGKEFDLGSETVTALDTLSHDVAAGRFVAVVGPSGCGKSTLLRLIAGLEKPSSGSIEIEAGRVRRPVGFVFQDAVLLPWKTVEANVRFPLDTGGTKRAQADATVRDLLALTGLSGFAKALPRQLSGGMRQRAAIARALAEDPPILLMDEPFSAVDLLTRETLNDELLRIWERTGKTVVLVTHSVEEAAYLADEVMVLSAHPGRLVKTYEVALARPRNEATKLDRDYHELVAALRRDLRGGRIRP